MHLYVYCIGFFGWEIQTLFMVSCSSIECKLYISKTNIFSSSWITQYSINNGNLFKFGMMVPYEVQRLRIYRVFSNCEAKHQVMIVHIKIRKKIPINKIR